MFGPSSTALLGRIGETVALLAIKMAPLLRHPHILHVVP